ncbi:MAG: hypothetical protein HOL22_01105 [Euryarchaeota archaeon]|jgi:hypothetical protein|nr:hypothetical protein [Euryarchaeota archaeon]MBT6640207.1 hypothetical protein [Euryarchaeota archaeon]MBT6844717.1 hypothetical protein [Euryarchaeota archaeon]MBT7263020.1 hypothetical protein [Euryarchaeota archaeon]MBT7637435.1 hypothetical protein [Euryarchaeota archaeon]
MAAPLTFLGFGIFCGLIFAMIRSRSRKKRRLYVAARREKHAPKTTEIPTRFTSSGNRIKISERAQKKVAEQNNQSADTDESTEQTSLGTSSRQVDELSGEEREEYDVRDQARDENLISLRLLVEDLFDPEDNSLDGDDNESFEEEEEAEENYESSSIELRNTWIEQNEEPLNEHASFVEQEEIGSGIMVMDSSDIVNDDIEERLEREGGKTGEVQISLAWDDFNDLDLHMFCPSGERIYFNNKKSECGGELDVDMNVRPTSNNAVENIVWTENAPLGKYKVGVHFYKHHPKEDTTPTCVFRLRVTIHGNVRDYSGSITHGQAMQMVTSFTLNDNGTQNQ